MNSSPAQADHQLTETCLDFIERAYDWETPDEPWLTSVVDAAWRLWGNASWALGLFYDASDGSPFRYSNLVFAGASPAIRAFAPVLLSGLPPSLAGGVYQSATVATGADNPAAFPDLFGINGLDPSGMGCYVGLAVSRATTTAAQVAVSQRLSSHLASAYRCRRRLRGAGRAEPARQLDGEHLALLTEREQQVVRSAATGKSTKEIAYELGIGHSTTRVLLSRACRRLGVRNRDELLALPAMRLLLPSRAM